MTLDTLCVATSMTPGDRHLMPACSQLEGALDRRPSLAEREKKKNWDSGGKRRVGVQSRGVQGQLSLVTLLQAAVAISLSRS